VQNKVVLKVVNRVAVNAKAVFLSPLYQFVCVNNCNPRASLESFISHELAKKISVKLSSGKRYTAAGRPFNDRVTTDLSLLRLGSIT
jgi:hypothetical protein